jgi:hypothetical protein
MLVTWYGLRQGDRQALPQQQQQQQSRQAESQSAGKQAYVQRTTHKLVLHML